MQEFIDQFNTELTSRVEEVEVSGDMAFALVSWEQTMTPKAEGDTTHEQLQAAARRVVEVLARDVEHVRACRDVASAVLDNPRTDAGVPIAGGPVSFHLRALTVPYSATTPPRYLTSSQAAPGNSLRRVDADGR
jgi:hypothetical protein